MAHEKLDRAVAAAYGWDDYTPAMPDEEILRRLLALNQARATKPFDKGLLSVAKGVVANG